MVHICKSNLDDWVEILCCLEKCGQELSHVLHGQDVFRSQGSRDDAKTLVNVLMRVTHRQKGHKDLIKHMGVHKHL